MKTRAVKLLLSNVDALLLAVLVASLTLNVGLGIELKGYHAARSSRPSILGRRIAGLHVSDLDGRPLALNVNERSRPAIVYVFRSSCPWCRRNLANIRAVTAHAIKEYNIIGLGLEDAAHTRAYVADAGHQFQSYVALEDGAIRELDLGETPETIVISSDGVVRSVWSGAFTQSRKSVEAYFRVRLPGLTD